MNNPLSRRTFLQGCAACSLGASIVSSQAAPKQQGGQAAPGQLKEAMFWEPLTNGRTKCTICPNACERGNGVVSLCKSRINKGGKFYSLTYGKPCVISPDPLAKNPLYHVMPGTSAIATSTAGCNLTCKYCQNWDISQCGPEKTKNMENSPSELVAQAKTKGFSWITFTYTEPVSYYEYAIDTAQEARKNGIRIAVSTAGFVCTKPLAELMKHVDAFSVTYKGATQDFYRDVCGANLADVQRSITEIFKAKKWMEVVNLIIPGMNDDDAGIKSIARFLAGLSRDIPLHFLRFAPAYKLQHLQQTPVATLEKAHAIARKEGLKYVYLALPGHQASTTYCPSCKKPVIERSGLTVVSNTLKNGHCHKCSTKIPGIFV